MMNETNNKAQEKKDSDIEETSWKEDSDSDNFTVVAHSRIEFVNIKEEYSIDEDEDAIRVIKNEEVVDESALKKNMNAWPVTIQFKTACKTADSVINDKNDNSDSYKDEDSTEDEESFASSSSSSVENDNTSDVSVNVDSRKRRKVLKMRRRKPKLQFNSQLRCNECSVQCHTQTEMSMHLYTVHNIDNTFKLNNRFACRLCKRTFVSKLYLEAHITQIHTEKRVINCIKCNKVFKYRSYLTGNITNSDTPRYKNFTCFHCSVKHV